MTHAAARDDFRYRTQWMVRPQRPSTNEHAKLRPTYAEAVVVASDARLVLPRLATPPVGGGPDPTCCTHTAEF